MSVYSSSERTNADRTQSWVLAALRRIAIVATGFLMAAAIAGVVVVGGHLHRAQTARRATPLPAPVVTRAAASTMGTWTVFHDAQGELLLSARQDPEHLSLVDVALTIYSVGNVAGTLQTTSLPTGVDAIASTSAPVTFVPAGSTTARNANITVLGSIDFGGGSAHLAITFAGQAYALVDSSPSAAAAAAVAAAVAQDMVAGNWAGVYSMMDFEQQHYVSESTFVAAMNHPSQAVQVVSIQVSSVGQSEAVDGILYWSQPMLVLGTLNGAAKQYSMTIILEAEGGSWHFVRTSVPT